MGMDIEPLLMFPWRSSVCSDNPFELMLFSKAVLNILTHAAIRHLKMLIPITELSKFLKMLIPIAELSLKMSSRAPLAKFHFLVSGF